MIIRDNRWIVRVTEWQPRDSKRNQGRQRTRWRDEIRSFTGGIRNNRHLTEMSGKDWARPLPCSELLRVDDDDGDVDHTSWTAGN